MGNICSELPKTLQCPPQGINGSRESPAKWRHFGYKSPIFAPIAVNIREVCHASSCNSVPTEVQKTNFRPKIWKNCAVMTALAKQNLKMGHGGYPFCLSVFFLHVWKQKILVQIQTKKILKKYNSEMHAKNSMNPPDRNAGGQAMIEGEAGEPSSGDQICICICADWWNPKKIFVRKRWRNGGLGKMFLGQILDKSTKCCKVLEHTQNWVMKNFGQENPRTAHPIAQWDSVRQWKTACKNKTRKAENATNQPLCYHFIVRFHMPGFKFFQIINDGWWELKSIEPESSPTIKHMLPWLGLMN